MTNQMMTIRDVWIQRVAAAVVLAMAVSLVCVGVIFYV
jgi:hypothetical protein